MSPRESVAATREKLESVSATRTVEQRRGRNVWDLTLIRGADTATRSITIHELREKIIEEGLRRLVRLAELELARATETPPPPLEEPDPDWVDIVAIAQAEVDSVDALVEDLNYLLGVLERAGE